MNSAHLVLIWLIDWYDYFGFVLSVCIIFFMLKVFDNLCCNLMIISEKNYLPKVSKYIFISA